MTRLFWTPFLILGALALAAAGLYLLPLRSRPARPRRSGPSARIVVPDYHANWLEDEIIVAEGAGKPWVRDAAGSERWTEGVGDLAVTCRRPRPGGEIVGYSGLEATPEDARRRAREHAAEELLALVAYAVKEEQRALRTRAVLPLIEEIVRHELDAAGRVADRFEQVVRRPYGTVYRAAVLVPAGRDEVIRPIAAKVLDAVRRGWIEARERRKEIAWTGLSIAALLVAIYLLYAFANAGTKGHFAWPLRILSLAAFAGLCLGILYLRGWLG